MKTAQQDIMITGLPETGMKALVDYLILNGLSGSYYGKTSGYKTTSSLAELTMQPNKEVILSNSAELLINNDPLVEVKQGNHIYLYCDVWDYIIYAGKHHRKTEDEAIGEWIRYSREVLQKADKGSIVLSSYAFMQQPARVLSILNDQFGYSFDAENAKQQYQDFYTETYFHTGHTIALIRKCKQHEGVAELTKQLHKAAVWPHDIIAEGQTKPKVDVIIPCYNLGHLIEDTIASLERSFSNDFNVIIIDDGSTKEDSIAGVKRVEELGYKVIWQANTGLCKALNNAIKEGTGEYLLVLSADDKLDPKFITQSTAVLDNQEKVGVVYTNPKTFQAWYSMWLTPDFEPARFLSLNFIVATSLFRRTYWENAGGYDPLADGNEDWEMWMSCMEQGALFYHIDEYLFHYRFMPGSKIQTCNLPHNRKRLVEHMSGKHKALYAEYLPQIIGTLHYTISDIEMRKGSAPVPDSYKSIDQIEVEQGVKVLGKPGEFMYRLLRKSGHLHFKRKAKDS